MSYLFLEYPKCNTCRKAKKSAKIKKSAEKRLQKPSKHGILFMPLYAAGTAHTAGGWALPS